MKIRKLLFLLLSCGLFLILAALGGCGTVSSAEDAEKVAARFYEAAKAGDYATVAGMFINADSGARAVDQLKLNQNKLGNLQSYKLRDATVNTVFSGRRFTLKYVTKYPEYGATEWLIMFENVSEPGIKIEVYKVDSKGLQH